MIFILFSSCMNRILTGIGLNLNLSPLLLLFTIFEQMCLDTFSDDSNPYLNEVQLVVSKLLMFHENIDLLRSGDSCDLSPGNNDPTKFITLVLVGLAHIIFFPSCLKQIQWSHYGGDQYNN